MDLHVLLLPFSVVRPLAIITIPFKLLLHALPVPLQRLIMVQFAKGKRLILLVAHPEQLVTRGQVLILTHRMFKILPYQMQQQA